MLRHFLEYEKIENVEGFKIQEGIDGEEFDATQHYYDFFKYFGLTIAFYLLFLLLFVIGGSILLKYSILVRTVCLPVNLEYRDKNTEYISKGDIVKPYDAFFDNTLEKKEKLMNEFSVAKPFEFSYDKDGKKSKIYLPLYTTYNYYYDKLLVRADKKDPSGTTSGNSMLLGNVFTLTDDIEGKTGTHMNDNFTGKTMRYAYTLSYLSINWLFSNIFNFLPLWGTILLAFLYAISGVITLIESTVSSDNPGGITNLTGKILSPILTSTFFWTFFIIAICLSVFNTAWAAFKCFVNITNLPGSEQFWWYTSTDLPRNVLFYANNNTTYRSQSGKAIQWAVFCSMIVARYIAGLSFAWICAFLGILVAMAVTFNSISKIFGSAGCFYIDGELKPFTWWNTLIWLLPIFCFTRWSVFIPLLYAIVIIALCVHPPLGGGVFLCLTICIWLFSKKLQELKDSYLKLVYDAYEKNKDIVEKEPIIPTETNSIEPVECRGLKEKIDNGEVVINPAIKNKSKIEERVEKAKLNTVKSSPKTGHISPVDSKDSYDPLDIVAVGLSDALDESGDDTTIGSNESTVAFRQ